MKDIARILRLAVWRSHAVTVATVVVSMLAALAPAAHAKDISPMEAVRIARRVVNPAGRLCRQSQGAEPHGDAHPTLLYITTRGDRVLSSLPTTRWEKYQTIRMSIK